MHYDHNAYQIFKKYIIALFQVIPFYIAYKEFYYHGQEVG